MQLIHYIHNIGIIFLWHVLALQSETCPAGLWETCPSSFPSPKPSSKGHKVVSQEKKKVFVFYNLSSLDSKELGFFFFMLSIFKKKIAK